jgi:hypothetical protein
MQNRVFDLPGLASFLLNVSFLQNEPMIRKYIYCQSFINYVEQVVLTDLHTDTLRSMRFTYHYQRSNMLTSLLRKVLYGQDMHINNNNKVN